jgi:hypothetical protein
MPLQHEIAWLVSERCEEIGLTPEKLARLAGVDVHIVRQLLDGTALEIGISDAECIAHAVGLSLGVHGRRRRPKDAASVAVIAARTASTSFKDSVPPEALMQSLQTGIVPADYRPHLRALLDEAPIGLLAGLAYELHDECAVPPRETWQRMRTMAGSLACFRDLWN